MRGYFSTYFLFSARYMARSAGDIEDAHQGRSRFDLEHRACVLSSILSSGAFLEANINEIFQDSCDAHTSYVGSLPEDVTRMMAELWKSSDSGVKLRALDKYQMLLALSGHEPLDRAAQAYQDAALTIRLRNALAHYQPETVSLDLPTRMEEQLRGKFLDNKLMTGSGNPWWPDHALGRGCADWAIESTKQFVDRVMEIVGIEPNHARHEKSGWLDLPSPKRSAGTL